MESHKWSEIRNRIRQDPSRAERVERYIAEMSYFGEPWPSGVCEEGTRTETPVGAECLSCGEVIEAGDQGSFIGGWAWTGDAEHAQPIGVKSPVHRECSLRDVLGGIGHLTNHLHWCGGRRDPDGGMSRRKSAVLVWQWVQDHGFSDAPEP